MELFKATPKDEFGKVMNLLQGKLYPDYVGVELGVAEKLLTRAIAEVTGKSESCCGCYLQEEQATWDLSVEQLLERNPNPR